MHIDIQLSPAVDEWGAIRDAVVAAEARGFHTTWAFDHFAGAMMGGDRMLECFSVLGALAAITDRMRIGTLVVNAANRTAAVMAQSAASIQLISGGRFTLGLGAGAAPGSRWSAEHDLLGIDLGRTMAERHRRFAATLDELDRWWDPGRPAELATFALPAPRPAIVVGVNSVPLAELAGRRTDGINVRGDHELIEQLVDAAERGREAAGRTGAPWDCSVWTDWDDALFDPDHPQRRRWASLGVTRMVLVFRTPHDLAAIERSTPLG